MALALVIAFLVVPIVEIYVIIQVGQVIGAWPTVLLLVVESLIGAWIVKREGRVAWAALQRGASEGRLPGRELADAALVLVGGVLLLTPGFVTDVVGFFFVLPPTRPLARRLLAWFVARRATIVIARRAPWASTAAGAWGAGRRSPGPSGSEPGRATGDSRVVPGETVPSPRPPGGGPGAPDPPLVERPDDERPGRATEG